VRTLTFAAIVAGNLALIFVNRSYQRTGIEMLRAPNAVLWGIAVATLCALGLAIYAPPVASVFRFAALSAGDLAIALAAGIAGAAWLEVWKALAIPHLHREKGKAERG
jgi:Ca2+-transporting ATPase